MTWGGWSYQTYLKKSHPKKNSLSSTTLYSWWWDKESLAHAHITETQWQKKLSRSLKWWTDVVTALILHSDDSVKNTTFNSGNGKWKLSLLHKQTSYLNVTIQYFILEASCNCDPNRGSVICFALAFRHKQQIFFIPLKPLMLPGCEDQIASLHKETNQLCDIGRSTSCTVDLNVWIELLSEPKRAQK